MPPTLVILAAGLGSRYGGLKQMDPLGPQGQTILDYSIYDAQRAGFATKLYSSSGAISPTPFAHASTRTRWCGRDSRWIM